MCEFNSNLPHKCHISKDKLSHFWLLLKLSVKKLEETVMNKISDKISHKFCKFLVWDQIIENYPWNYLYLSHQKYFCLTAKVGKNDTVISNNVTN